MYEFRGGTGRLAYALWRAANDNRMRELASILYYCEDTLVEDAQAMVDYFEAFRDMDRPDQEK